MNESQPLTVRQGASGGDVHPAVGVSSAWFSAAMIGSLWASIEIVVGSFLHNIHLPLSGTILSAASVFLLVSFDRLIPAKGLFWRSGIICAAMKTLSPSAFIIGPMIGILAEAFLLEGSMFFLGRTTPGYILGGALAVSWSLMQKVLGTIILYGSNVVDLFSRMVAYASEVTGITALSPEGLLGGLIAIDLVLGGSVAAMGIAIGRRRHAGTPLVVPPEQDRSGEDATVRSSLPMLLFFIAGIAGSLALLGTVPAWQGAGWTGVFCGIVVIRHPRLTHQFRKPRLWVEMVAITLLAGLFLGGVGRTGAFDGFLQGVEMCLRAIVLVFGFAAVGMEMRNPAILRWFSEHSMNTVVTSTKIAFGVLPAMLSLSGSRTRWFRHPLRNILAIVHEVYRWAIRMRGRVIIVSGDRNAGKTSFVGKFVEIARERGLSIGGFLAPGIWSDGAKRGFDLQEISTGKQMLFCSMDGPPDHPLVGRFHISPEGLAFGREVLSPPFVVTADAIIIDEIGPLELRGDGWGESLEKLVATRIPLVLVVRTELVERVQQHWDLRESQVIDIRTATPESVLNSLLS